MKTIEILLEKAHDIWNSYNSHPFILEMQNGTLPRKLFRHYILQDTLYLKDYAKVFALGTAKANDIGVSSLFARYIPLMHGEMDVHGGYLERLNISSAELEATKPTVENISYTSYMLRVAYEESATEILAAVLPCAYSYEIIAQKMTLAAPNCTDNDFYGDWIRSYSSKEYSESNKALLDVFESLTVDMTDEKLAHLSDIFVTCSVFEKKFWDMAYNMHI